MNAAAEPLWRWPRRVDLLILLAVVALLVLSVLLVATTTRHQSGGSGPYLTRHLATMGAGLILGVVACCLGRRLVIGCVVLGYPLLLAVLGLVLVAGRTVNGSTSWLSLPGGFSLQPSELGKVIVVAALASWFGIRLSADDRPGLREVAVAVALAGVPLVLVLAQPDLGTVVVLSLTVLAVLAVAGAGWRVLVPLLLAGGTGLALVVRAGVLADYQVARFTAFLDPEADIQGVGYNTHQSVSAIAAGRLTGQGLFHGAATQGGFVPEQHTDFVFSAAGEELGFVGAGLLVVALTTLIVRILAVGRRSGDRFGQVLCAGVATWFAVQGFENVAMCLGLAPVTGVPLPFVSFGGTAMLAGLAALGLVLGVDARTRARQITPRR